MIVPETQALPGRYLHPPADPPVDWDPSVSGGVGVMSLEDFDALIAEAKEYHGIACPDGPHAIDDVWAHDLIRVGALRDEIRELYEIIGTLTEEDE